MVSKFHELTQAVGLNTSVAVFSSWSFRLLLFLVIVLFSFCFPPHVKSLQYSQAVSTFNTFTGFKPSKGGRRCLLSLLSGISGLSFDSSFLSPLLFFCLILGSFCLVSSLLMVQSADTLLQNNLRYFLLKDRPFCVTVNSW